MTDNPLLLAALAYAERGWPVFPLHNPVRGRCSCGHSDCNRQAKHPRTLNGLDDATTDVERIRSWWKNWTDANVGIRTGVGCDLIDCDGAGIDVFIAWCVEHNMEPRDYPRAVTGRKDGGRHILIAPTGYGNFTGLLPGVDFKGRRGYLVAPPSQHISGNHYTWKQEPNGSIPQAPAAFIELLAAFKPQPAPPPSPSQGGTPYGLRAMADEMQRLALAPEGQRNDTLNRVAFALFRLVAGNELLEGNVEAGLRMWARGIGLDEREIGRTIASAREAGYAKPRSAPRSGGGAPASTPTGTPDPEELHHADLDNAIRLVAHMGGDWRYSASEWYHWDGRRWAESHEDVVSALALVVVKKMLRDAEDDKAAAKWAIQSRNRSRIQAMVFLARYLILIDYRDLDQDMYIITAGDGTIDLRTGTLGPHEQRHMATKLAPVTFAGTQGDDEWRHYLELVIPDPAVRGWFQRLVGSSLLGRNAEERIPFIIGPAATGKTTVLEALRCALGDYAGVVAFRSLLESTGSGAIRADLVALRGLRFVVAAEVSEGQRWDAGLIKTLTGGEAIVARRPYKMPITFVPTFVVFCAANAEPKVDADDDGMWRRLAMVRFDVTFQTRDPAVKRRMTNPAQIGGAVLRWAVEGCLAYQLEGLSMDPPSVIAATTTYRSTQDRIHGFLEEHCVVTKDQYDYIPASELYEAYQRWCQANGERFPMTQTAMGKKLRDRGCEPSFNVARTARWWRGVRWRVATDVERVQT